MSSMAALQHGKQLPPGARMRRGNIIPPITGPAAPWGAVLSGLAWGNAADSWVAGDAGKIFQRCCPSFPPSVRAYRYARTLSPTASNADANADADADARGCTVPALARLPLAACARRCLPPDTSLSSASVRTAPANMAPLQVLMVSRPLSSSSSCSSSCSSSPPATTCLSLLFLAVAVACSMQLRSRFRPLAAAPRLVTPLVSGNPADQLS
jgi:hypothetical protein